MDAERARAFLLALPYVKETRQWGDNIVFWIGDKAGGGKMFCLLNLDIGKQDGGGHGVASFAADPERYAEWTEREGLRPAPYLARAFWVGAEHWNALLHKEWQQAFTEAHARVLGRLPKRVRNSLARTE